MNIELVYSRICLYFMSKVNNIIMYVKDFSSRVKVAHCKRACLIFNGHLLTKCFQQCCFLGDRLLLPIGGSYIQH